MQQVVRKYSSDMAADLFVAPRQGIIPLCVRGSVCKLWKSSTQIEGYIFMTWEFSNYL